MYNFKAVSGCNGSFILLKSIANYYVLQWGLHALVLIRQVVNSDTLLNPAVRRKKKTTFFFLHHHSILNVLCHSMLLCSHFTCHLPRCITCGGVRRYTAQIPPELTNPFPALAPCFSQIHTCLLCPQLNDFCFIS